MTEPTTAPAAVPATAGALTTLGLGAAAWVVAVRQMNGMDMGIATELGSFRSFVGFWVAMMAAMMLPGTALAVFRRARVRGLPAVRRRVPRCLDGRRLSGVRVLPSAWIVGSRALTIAAGVYELTPLKRDCRRRCRERIDSGLAFGLSCVGSSIGLMLILVAVGVMSVTWMSLIAGLVFVQKLLRDHPIVDVPVALAIVGLGIVIVASPSLVPGLEPTM
jgi:predicted metal-binding membrane protein